MHVHVLESDQRDKNSNSSTDYLIEIVLYSLKPGTGGEFFGIMQSASVPLHQGSGIDVIWHGQSIHDPDSYGLIRGFADMATLSAAQSAFYASDAWRMGPRQAIIERIETTTTIIIPMHAVDVKDLREQGLNSPEFLRRLRVSSSAAVRTRRATASHFSHACALGYRTSRYNRTHPAGLLRASGRFWA